MDFRNYISNFCVADNDIKNCDVVNLFTNAPIKVVMHVIRDRLVKDKTLSKHVDLSTDDIISLLKFIISMTYFQFDRVLHEQVLGTPMGSQVSVVVADMFMVGLVQFTMNSASPDVRPKIWKKIHQ